MILGQSERSWLIYKDLTLELAFLGFMFKFCDFHEIQVKETSYSHFDGSIESEKSSLVKLHI